jgi:cytochrome c
MPTAKPTPGTANGYPVASNLRQILAMKCSLILATMVAFPIGTAIAQDVANGQKVFQQCQICHAIAAGAQNKIGPELNGLDGRHSGTAANYTYSDANKNSGIVWNEATFKQYIANPQAMIPGTKMPFAGLKDPQQINDLWAYLKQFNADGSMKN